MPTTSRVCVFDSQLPPSPKKHAASVVERARARLDHLLPSSCGCRSPATLVAARVLRTGSNQPARPGNRREWRSRRDTTRAARFQHVAPASAEKLHRPPVEHERTGPPRLPERGPARQRVEAGACSLRPFLADAHCDPGDRCAATRSTIATDALPGYQATHARASSRRAGAWGACSRRARRDCRRGWRGQSVELFPEVGTVRADGHQRLRSPKSALRGPTRPERYFGQAATRSKPQTG